MELLLNYKKTGEPFWNLLYVGRFNFNLKKQQYGKIADRYVAPLLNEQQKVVFFIGGQINCSTTIHNHVDIMRILSQTDDVEGDKNKLAKPARGTLGGSKLNLLRAFRSQHDTSFKAVNRDAGMEKGLLNRIERMDMTTQMNMFYTAYSKVGKALLCGALAIL